MLEMTDVCKTYPGGNVALNNINIRIEQGEFVFLVGPSGAGKSTFIKLLFRPEGFLSELMTFRDHLRIHRPLTAI